MTIEVYCAGCAAFVERKEAPAGSPPRTYGQCPKCEKEFFRSGSPRESIKTEFGADTLEPREQKKLKTAPALKPSVM